MFFLMILFKFFLFVLLCMVKMPRASGGPLYRLCYRLKLFYGKKTKPTQTKRSGDERDELLSEKKGKAVTVQIILAAGTAVHHPMDKPGWVFYKFSVGSRLQEQSAEGSNLFPHFFPCLKRPPLLQLMLQLGWHKREVPAGNTDCPGALLPSLSPASNSPCPASPERCKGDPLEKLGVEVEGLDSGNGREAPGGGGR